MEVMNISEDEIKHKILSEIRGYERIIFNSSEYESLEDAIDSYVKKLYGDINNFEFITQGDIDYQNEDYCESFLEGAEEGDLVWAGELEIFHSLESIESHISHADRFMHKHVNYVRDIARCVKFYFIKKVMVSFYEQKKEVESVEMMD